MADKKYEKIAPEKFEFVNIHERLTDTKFDDKPIGYFKDAWIRFRKNKASVAAAVIIVLIFLFSFSAPLLTPHENGFMDVAYAKKGPRLTAFRHMGIFDGGMNGNYSEVGLVKATGIGVGAVNWDGNGVSMAEGMQSEYQPIIKLGDTYTQIDATKKEKTYYNARTDVYLNVGFMYKSIEQAELANIQAYEQETGRHVLYPLLYVQERL